MLIILGALAGALAAPTSVDWNTLPEVVAEVYDAGLGAAWASRADALDDARRAEPLPFQSVFLQAEPDPRPGANPLEGTQIAVQIGIGDRRGRQQALWRARGVQADAARTLSGWDYRQEVTDAYLAWWLADAVAAHLSEHAVELDRWLHPFAQGASEGTLSPGQVADLRAELSRLHAEEAQARYDAQVALGELSAHLGRPVAPSAHGLGALDDAPVEGANPWRHAQDILDAHPALRQLDAATEHAEARAAAARWATPAQLGVGTSLRAGPTGQTLAVPLLLVTVPLSNPSAPQAREARGEAHALALERGWAADRLVARLNAEADALDAAVQRWRALGEGVEAPLRARVERLEAGLAAGLVRATEVILARRDLHEAFHDRALAAAEVLRRRARGDALLSLAPTAPSESP